MQTLNEDALRMIDDANDGNRLERLCTLRVHFRTYEYDAATEPFRYALVVECTGRDSISVGSGLERCDSCRGERYRFMRASSPSRLLTR